MMVWSAEPKKGYLTREGIAVMRSKMTNAIFHEEMKELYIKKDAAYKESIQTAKESLLLYIRMLENSESADPVIEQSCVTCPTHWSRSMENTSMAIFPKRSRRRWTRSWSGWHSSRRWRLAMTSGGG